MNPNKKMMISQAFSGKFMYRYKSITQTIVSLIDPIKIEIEYFRFAKLREIPSDASSSD